MLNKERDYFCNRLLSGISKIQFNECTYILDKPSPSILVEASEIYNSIVSKNRFNMWITQDMRLPILKNQGALNIKLDEDFTEINKTIDSFKLELYKNAINKRKVQNVRNRLNSAKKTLDRMINIYHSFDLYTLEFYADSFRQQFIFVNTLKYENGDKVWLSCDSIDYALYMRLLIAFSKQMLFPEQLRELARTNPWRSYWDVAGDNIFGMNTKDLNDDQRAIISYSKLYDNAYQHSECPSQFIIDDDDMFDGWLLFQKEEYNKIKKNKPADMIHSNANEVFIPVSSMEEASDVLALNDFDVQLKNKRRQKALESAGRLTEVQLPDVQENLMMEMNRMKKVM